MNYKSLLKATIEKIADSFNENELAYLTITSKAENPLRDKIAYNLHSNPNLQDKIICREWKNRIDTLNKSRYDLAILNKSDGKVECLVEFKAHSLQRKETGYIKHELLKDLDRLEEIKDNGIEKYFVLFQNLPHTKFENHYNEAIKYSEEMNKYASKNPDIEQIRNQYYKWWKEDLINNDKKILNWHKVQTFSIKTGKCFDVEIDIEGFIYGPI